MPRFAPAALLACTLLVAASAVAPIPPQPGRGQTYFPIRKGAKVVYETHYMKDYTLVVTGVDEGKDGVQTVSVEIACAGSTGNYRVEVSPRGIYQLDDTMGRKYSAPDCLLKLPIKAGEEWTSKYSIPEGNVSITRKVRGIEKIETPAGKVEAVRVDEVGISINGDTLHKSYWYAVGIGLVRMGSDNDTDRELKSFTPAPE